VLLTSRSLCRLRMSSPSRSAVILIVCDLVARVTESVATTVTDVAAIVVAAAAGDNDGGGDDDD